ncbi:MAG: type II secretion system F family protein [Phycisphaerales bacterium]|jgi:type II secretory pathway component PulF
MASKFATLYGNLSVMLDAGLPILKTLNIATEGLQPGHFKIIFTDISKSVSQGNSLADSMDKYPGNFAKLDLMLIRSAELSAELPRCFKMLSEWHEFKNKIKHIILSGLLLPILIIHIAIFIFPFPLVILGKITIIGYLAIILRILGPLYLAVGLIIALHHSSQFNARLHVILDAIILRIPIINEAVRQLSICRYCRGFNLLYKAGLPIKECATQATELTGNIVVSDMFKGGIASIEAGKTAYEGFSRKLPKEYLELWYIGEETGELDKTVDKIAEISGDRAEHMFIEIAKWTPRIIYFMVIITLAVIIIISITSLYSSNMP